MTHSHGSFQVGETVETAFAHLEACLERFLAWAPVQEVHQLYDAIPDIAPENQRFILIELLKVDMAMAGELGAPRRIEHYLPFLGGRLSATDVPLDLVLEEIQLRREMGELPDPAEYVAKYPHLAGPIGEIMTPRESTATAMRLGRPPELLIGQVIDDFEILSVLGRGAFAGVYLARQESMQRLVALKVSVRGGEEPQALARLDHPNIVRVYDQRVCREPSVLLLYMQYLSGGTLADVIKVRNELDTAQRNGRAILVSIDRALLAARQPPPEDSVMRGRLASMDWPTAVAWVGVQLAEGLGYAHERGVLHRDVKPANVLLTAEGIPKLADFNVSHSGVSGRAGAAANFGGSLAYMSPEQLRVADMTDSFEASELDGRSDLYSLGILLWELWQGRRPWDTPASADSWGKAIGQQTSARNEQPHEPHRWGTAAERVLERAIRRTLAFNPERRPRNGQELAGRLRLALHPETAAMFEPEPHSLAGLILRIPVLLTAAVCIVLPNVAAALFNWFYNRQLIVDFDERFAVELGPMLPTFDRVANCVNVIAFPLGTFLLIYFTLQVVRGLRKAEANQPATEQELAAAWNLGTRAAVIGGALWMLAGLIYPVVLSWLLPQFPWSMAFQFFSSLTLCGGVAWIYPFFGLTLIAVNVYYPRLVAVTMTDDNFAQRARALRMRMVIYLFSAAMIPLFTLFLMILVTERQHFLLMTVMVTAVGLSAAFAAYQRLDNTLRALDQVLEQS